MRRIALASLLLILTALAGCSEDPPKAPAEEPIFEGEVQEGFGAIAGVVVDDRIQPIDGAKVTARGADWEGEATTDERGTFVFLDLTPGIYVLTVEEPRHTSAQTSVEVLEGDDPPTTRILLERIYVGEPYTQQVLRHGYFQCSQAGGGLYSSSNCVYDPYRWAFGPGGSPTQPVDNVTTQEREWHSDVGDGWKSLIFEMTWESSTAGTSEQLGIVVSTYKPERDGFHWFAEAQSNNPLLLRLEEGEVHPSASGVEPTAIPATGIQDMSYFVSVKQDQWPVPAFAVEQEFTIVLTQFYYVPAPEGWSFVAGDPLPY